MSKLDELTIEEIMGIASKDGKAVSNLTDDESNVKNFLRECGIKDGPTLVPNYKVYYDYCHKWKPNGKKLSKIGFLRKLSVVFESKRTKNVRYYLLNTEAFDISEESLNEAKEFDKRYRKKIKKKQHKKSRSTKTVQSDNETGIHGS